MLFNNPENLGLLETAILALFAAIGGALGYISRAITNGERLIWFRAGVEFFGSGFLGIVAMFACLAMGIDWMWSGAIIGVFGWLGAEGSIGILTKLIKKKLGVPVDVNVNGDNGKG